MIGKAKIDGIPSVVWIKLDPYNTNGTVKAYMDALEFDLAFQSRFEGTNYTPKFADYVDKTHMYLLMDNDSGGRPLLLSV